MVLMPLGHEIRGEAWGRKAAEKQTSQLRTFGY